jgi:hypothetical protein
MRVGWRGGRNFVIACDKRQAFAQGSDATKQSIYPLCRDMDCFASLAMTVALASAVNYPPCLNRASTFSPP